MGSAGMNFHCLRHFCEIQPWLFQLHLCFIITVNSTYMLVSWPCWVDVFILLWLQSIPQIFSAIAIINFNDIFIEWVLCFEMQMHRWMDLTLLYLKLSGNMKEIVWDRFFRYNFSWHVFLPTDSQILCSRLGFAMIWEDTCIRYYCWKQKQRIYSSAWDTFQRNSLPS